MDWEEIAISELYQRFETIYRSVDKAVFPGLCNASNEDVSAWPLLADGIACLTGATDRFGSPIIFIPHNEKLAVTSETDFKCAIKYLVAATNASSADVGFVVLIDSRQSRWNSLAWVLRNVASSFPGELKMILALRPTNIFHGTWSSLAMKYQKGELNYKVPIELVACIENMWPWISKTELPTELGGESQYDHSKWLRKRLVIEKLANVLKQAIHRCKAFSTSLINDQTFPDGETKQKVHDQNQQCKNVLQEVESLQKDGEVIQQDEIWLSDTSEKEPISTSVTEIQHLCSLVIEVKETFSQFWSTFEAKRNGYLQLKSFEKNYKKAANRISCLIENLEFGTENVDATTQNDSDLSSSPSNGKLTEICLQACTDGETLMRDHPYAIDCIKPKCEELKRLSQCFQTLMEEKVQNDNLFNQTKEDIEKVNEWSISGMKLLSVQNLDKAKSDEGLQAAVEELEEFTSTIHSLNIAELRKHLSDRTRALEPLEKSLEDCLIQFDLISDLFEKRKAILKLHPRPESPRPADNPLEIQETAVIFQTTPPKQDSNTAIVFPMHQNGRDLNPDHSEKRHKLRQVVNELVETEKKYVEELEEIVHGYGLAIDDDSMAEFVPVNLKENRRLLLGNLEEIMLFHQKCFFPKMIECDGDGIAIGNLFIDKISDFSLYYEFCHDSNKIKSFRKQIGEGHAFFVECQRRLGHRLPLSAYLLKPVQRITKYQLLLQQMQKYCDNSENDSLTRAVNSMMVVLKELNDSMHEISITGYQEQFSSLGRLLMQGSFQIQVESKRGKVKDFARAKFNKAIVRHLFLYENGILLCKKSQSSEQIHDNAENPKSGVKPKNDVENSYLFKKSIKMKELSLTETVKGCQKKFKLYCREDDTEFTITTPSNSIKQEWVKALQNCLNKHKEKTTTSTPHMPSKATLSKSPAKVSPKRQKSESQIKSQTSISGARKAKVQRSVSLRVNSVKPGYKTILHRQKTSASEDKTIAKKSSKRTKNTIMSKTGERSSGEVTFENIHGVDKSPPKPKTRNPSGDMKPRRKISSESSPHSTIREKKSKT